MRTLPALPRLDTADVIPVHRQHAFGRSDDQAVQVHNLRSLATALLHGEATPDARTWARTVLARTDHYHTPLATMSSTLLSSASSSGNVPSEGICPSMRT